MGYLGSLITDFGGRTPGLDVATDSGKILATRYLNKSYQYTYMSHHWEQRLKTGQVTLIPNLTGSCSVTVFDGTNEAASRIVTLGSALTGVEGRFLQAGDSEWHRIEYVNGTQVFLDTPILTTGTTFTIWKRFYYLPGEVAAILDFGNWNNRWGRMEYKSFSNLIDQQPDISESGSPETFTPFGVDNFQQVYTTGSISGAKDSNLITGLTTSWIGNVLPGDEIIVSDVVFHVKRVESDTRIILTNYLTDEIAGSTTYEIRRNMSVGFSFFPNEITTYMTVPYYYLDRVFDMKHETKDRTNFPDDFDSPIVTRAEYMYKKDKGGDNIWVAIAQLAKAELDDCKINFRVAKPRNDIFAPTVKGYSGR